MFTGLIESLGEISEVRPAPGGTRVAVRTSLGRELGEGDSIAVNGVCLTVTGADHGGLHADISPETARVTTLGAVSRAALVNLERPLRADARLGGHFVQGHVDAVGTIEELRADGDSFWLSVAYPPALGALIVQKGSIAVDGVSLTVARVDERRFGVQIIPYTWTHTNLHRAQVGAQVNLECDILGKYVARLLEASDTTTRARASN